MENIDVRVVEKCHLNFLMVDFVGIERILDSTYANSEIPFLHDGVTFRSSNIVTTVRVGKIWNGHISE